MNDIAANLRRVNASIAAAAAAAGRAPAAVRLIAVTKTFPADAVRQAVRAGHHAFGESYVQEAVDKIREVAALQELNHPGQAIEWHFIGPIQSNKTRPIAEHFDWVHSVDRARIAQRLNDQRPAGLPALNVCIQVNISGEQTKSGVAADDLHALVQAIAGMPRLVLRGLMAIPRPTDDVADQRTQFRAVRRLLERENAAGAGLDTLSMGMSDDLEAAIAEGATIVRVGRAIFGDRS